MDLNGIWDLAREHEAGEQRRGFVAEKKVAVPSSYNDLYAEEGFRMWFDGMWYSRTFVVPRMLAKERLVLRFGSASYRAEVYVNGTRVGSHASGYTPFEFDITAAVDLDGENLLCVRLENVLSAETVPMGRLNNKPENGQFAGQYPDVPFDFFPYAGIQRNVCIYTTSPLGWLTSTRVETNILDGGKGGVNLECAVAGDGAATARFRCAETGCEVQAPVVAGRVTADLTIDDVKLWGVYDPNL